MTIEEIVENRNIEEILHFTTNEGLLGILTMGFLKSRERLPLEKRLIYIFQPNATFRKDTGWLDYVNLSISRINFEFFKVASQKWHRERNIWWCVLSFDPAILSHRGVYFATTNNFYPSVIREKGPHGIEALFGKTIKGKYGNSIQRPTKLPPKYTTCPQAEVLYPEEISTRYLRKIYISKEEHHDDICAYLISANHKKVEVEVKPEIFEEFPG